MGTRSPARSWARSSVWAASRARRTIATSLGLGLGLGLAPGCGDASLDERPRAPHDESTSTADTLPPLDTGEPLPSTGDASTGEPAPSDDPRLCAAECALVLPPSWTYDATPPRVPAEPAAHVVPAMLHDPDGTITVAELVAGEPRLHRLDGEGHLQWNVPLPLSCDPCELSDVALHPSGDLLLSAMGLDDEGTLELIAARYDATRHARVWQTKRAIEELAGVHERSGDIAALPDGLVAQLYLRGVLEFEVEQRTLVVAYDADGVLVDEEVLLYGSATSMRPPLLARPTAEGALLVGIFGGSSDPVYGIADRIWPPLWELGGSTYVSTSFDDIVLDASGNSIDVGHYFEGTHAYLLLSERSAEASDPRWVAQLALPSTTTSPATLALGPDGDVYVAIRTTQAPGGTGEPLAGLSLSRWTSEGELRWHTTLLQALADSVRPLRLAVDRDEGLVIAAIVDGGLRVERRAQQCACGS